jgi:hypothetical protein
MHIKYLHKKVIYFLGVSICLLLVSGSVYAGQAPRIHFKQDTWDFGPTKQGKNLTHTFIFTNSGEETLKIVKVLTSCGCTAALLSKKIYEAGEKGEIKVTFNTRGYEGEVSKYLYVKSNDPKQPNKMLTVSASIDVPPRPKIELNQYSLDLGLILEGEKIQVNSKIQNRGEKELSVVLSHRDIDFFFNGKKITSALKIKPKKSKEITFKIPTGQKNGLIREYVLMRSNDPMRPNLSLYLSGYVVSKQQLKDLFDKYKNSIQK